MGKRTTMHFFCFMLLNKFIVDTFVIQAIMSLQNDGELSMIIKPTFSK